MLKNLRAGFSILLLMVCVGVALTDEVPLPNTPKLSIARFALAGVAIVAIVYFIFFKSDIATPRALLGPPRFVAPSRDEIAQQQVAIARYVKNNRGAAELFFNMLGNLPEYLMRIRETVEILEEIPQLRITRHKSYYIGPEAPQVLLIPLARVEKGTLLDDFAVTDGSGNALPTIPYNRTRGLVAVALEGLMDTAISASKDKIAHLPAGSIQQTRDDVVGKLIEIIFAGHGRHSESERNRQAQSTDRNFRRKSGAGRSLIKSVTRNSVKLLFGGLWAPSRPEQDLEHPTEIELALASIKNFMTPEWHHHIMNFCDQHVDHYVIVAEVNVDNTNLKDGHFTLSYSHRVPLDAVTSTKERWRRFFGLMPCTIDVPLNLFAFQVEAYHQEISTEPGQYVFDHHLERLDSAEPVNQAALTTEDFKPYVRLYADARPNAHLYIRRQVGAPPSSASEASPGYLPSRPEGADEQRAPTQRTYPGRLKSVVEFREIPPGTLGAATVIALASAAIISFFAVTHSGLDIDPNPPSGQADIEQIKATLNSDVPALLLALPAFVGVLIGSWLDLSHLRRASLTTYLALTMTMFLSLGSALYFVFDANRKLPTATVITVHGLKGIQLTTDWIWLALMAVAVTHFLFLLRRAINLSKHYSTAVSKRIDKSLQFG